MLLPVHYRRITVLYLLPLISCSVKNKTLLPSCSLHSSVALTQVWKSTHISMISNSVTHLRSYTNSAIADIAGNSAPISPVTPCNHRRLHIERRYRRIKWPPHNCRRRCPKRRRLRIERRYRHIECRVFECFMMFHNVLRMFHDVLLVVHDALRCIKMFYMMF